MANKDLGFENRRSQRVSKDFLNNVDGFFSPKAENSTTNNNNNSLVESIHMISINTNNNNENGLVGGGSLTENSIALSKKIP